MDILMKIQEDYLNFSKQEKKIADYILRFSHEINNMKIGELANRTGTSNASITRFVKRIGCNNYSDMKFLINAKAETKENQETHGIADEVFVYYQNVIKNTQRLIDINKIKEFLTLIKQASNINIIGISSSGVTADLFSIRLMRMGLTAKSYSDPLWMLMQASIAKPGDLYIAISNSGTTHSIVETLTEAKKNGATIVSITGYFENPVSKLSDLVFYVYNTRFVHDEKFSNSQFSMVYLMDVITTFLLEDEEFKDKTLKTREIVGDL
ncbi:MurR/RpiR family transcriptional regulator [Oceanobacillus neutriphilus]|uniref:RpiR family transcriptional regulator n=1 Tax=Oceanobacillus neutriphilus TaxID=531815 RepID=A0ABQ2NUY8_9BACI|nr:MurR/RpiR family transcriptional regulator [Oceanobacillus neutriphilus]GGP11138.1 RpiR family transcriptional regulator [Oceanobacillus neutriphilus]